MSKITVSTSSQTLTEILVAGSVTVSSGISDLIIKNAHASITIYVELGADATTASSYPIGPGESLTIADINWEDVNLIAGTENTTVYVLRRNV